MAYSRGRGRSGRSSYRRGSVSSRRQVFQAKQWGSFGLTTANQYIQPIDILGHYQNMITTGDPSGTNISTDVGRATILGVRGWITFFLNSNTIFPDTNDQRDTRIGFGLRVAGTDSVANISSLTERERSHPYNELNRTPWDSWMWRRSRPLWPKAEVPEGATLGYDALAAAWSYKFGINTKNMRKLAMGESLYLFGGMNFDPGSTGDVSVAYELNTVLARP